MKNKSIWSDCEKKLFNKVLEKLVIESRFNDYHLLNKNLTALNCQAGAFILYPGIIESSKIAGQERNVETLVTELGRKYSNEDMFVLPTKALLGKCLIIGKINLMYMVYHLTCRENENPEVKNQVFEFIINYLLSILTEEVLLQLLNNASNTIVLKKVTKALANIWEEWIFSDKVTFIPELGKMWLTRKRSVPVFGTLLGTHEYISLFQNVDNICKDYITYATSVSDETSALEEFLFGLPHEELNFVKNYLLNNGKQNINCEEVKNILGKDSIFLSNKTEDPLELYRFYNYRRKCASSRLYGKMKGPVRTFEENFVMYLFTNQNYSFKIL